MGSDAIALPMLESLMAFPSAHLAGVWTQPDRPHGRGQRLLPGPIKTWALERGLPVFQPLKPDASDLDAMRGLGTQLILVMAYGHILRQPTLDLPELGCFNLHTSRLPKYRGASPIQTAVASGESGTAVTLMRMEAGLDTGPIVDFEPIPIGPTNTAGEVEASMASACVPLLARNFPRMLRGGLHLSAQNHEAATYCRRLEKADGVLDFSAPARLLAARINGLHPWPCCSLLIKGETVKIGRAGWRASTISDTPGAIVGASGDALEVACGEGVLRLLELQRPGGRMLGAGEFLRGFPIPAGTLLASHPMPPLVSPTPFPWKRPTG
jgi:methionyl-tRNA formyltransferase